MTIFDLATQAALDGLTQQVVLADTLLGDRLIVLADRVTKLEAPPIVVPPSPPPIIVTNPGVVTTLRVNAATETTLGLRFTEIDNGAGLPANYLVRIAPSPINWGATPNAVVLPGLTTGAPREFLLPSLQPNTKYDVQLIAFRGTLNVDAVFGPLSAVLTAITAPVVVPPVVPPIIVPPPAGLLFASDWVSGKPADNWDMYEEFLGNHTVGLMSVVPGFGPGGRNALKVLQHGPTQAANLRKLNVITPGQDYYVRFYFRTDDVSSSADHIVTCELYTYGNLTYLRKSGGPMDWRHTVSFYGCGYVYPIGHWFLRNRLPNHTWFRIEFFVHWTSPTSVQVHPRVSDEAGVLLYTDADYQQSDPGSQLWNGKSDWTLASYYAAGYDFCVRPAFLTEFGLGNNGQTGALDNGLAWYFAGVEIRTDRWPGP